MPSQYSSSSFLLPSGDGYSYRFHSRGRLEMLLDISSPYGRCIAYAPYARNAPYCSRPINRQKQYRVSGLLAQLSQVRFPSTEAGRLLEELSTRVVCGITGWHQNKAAEVYDGWCDSLWGEYLRVNGLDPGLGSVTPRQLTSLAWEIALRETQCEQQGDSEEDDSSDEDT